jgi:four helix bundle protein
MKIESYRDLKVWQLSICMIGDIYRLTAALPPSELYGLMSQSRRAAVSVAANISEGHARQSTKEFLYFLSISLGSLAELETLLIVSQPLAYYQPAQLEPLLSQTGEIGKMLRGLQKSLRAKLDRSD